MSEHEVFFILDKAVTKAIKEGANETAMYLHSELSKLPTTLKIFVVAKTDEYVSDNEIVCESRQMAEELWKSNKDFKRMYYYNPKGDCTTIKTRK